ncbi:MAG: RNA polymerase sigma factor, partial [Nocardioidaceae bacterium]
MDHTPDGRAAAAPEIPSAHRRSTGALPDDSTLVARLRDRDEDTFTHLVDTWTPTMMHVARTRVSTAESAAEVVQDTWLAVLTGIDRFEARSSLRTWVFRILLNKATTRGAREARTVPWSTLAADDGGPTVDPARFRGPDDQYPGHWRSFPRQWP